MTFINQRNLSLFVVISALSFLAGGVSSGFADSFGVVRRVSAPTEETFSAGRQKIVSSTDMATVRLNLVNHEPKAAFIRLRVYDQAEQEVQTGQMENGISIEAGASKQVILVFPIGKARQQNMRICAQLNVGAGKWIEKSCSQFRVQRVAKPGI